MKRGPDFGRFPSTCDTDRLPACPIRGWVTGLVAWCLGCWLGGFGAWADWDSAGLGLGWVGRGRLAARLDWAWAWADWGSAELGSVDWARLGARLHWGSAGAVGARVHWGSGAGGLGVGARELERGLDWGVVGLGRGWIGCGWFGHNRGELMGAQANGGGMGGYVAGS